MKELILVIVGSALCNNIILSQFQGQFLISGLAGQGKTALAVFLIHVFSSVSCRVALAAFSITQAIRT